MSERVHAPKKSEGFHWVESVPDANAECATRTGTVKMRCAVCRRSVLLHCNNCKLQLTACLCTMIERLEPLEMYKKLAAEMGQTRARAVMKGYGYEMPYLPFLPD